MGFEKPTRILWLLLAAAVLTVYVWEDSRHTTHPPGVLVSEEPSQNTLSNGPTWMKDGFQFRARARFSARVRVLSTARYWFDGASGVSPIDFAVGWGPLSDQRVIDRIGFGQTARWWRYWPSGSEWPIPAADIASHGANMHMIPAGKLVLKALRDVRAGDLISLTGYLVDVETEGGWKWSTSLTRADSGNGACEIVWVESLLVH